MSSPLADLIQRGESGSKSYDNYNRGTYLDGDGRERIRGADRAIDFSTMTVGEVMDLQALPRGDTNRLFAVGRYQVIPDTMRGAVATLGISRDEPFSDALQDRIFSDYLITNKRSVIAGYITGEPGAGLADAQLALAKEWASIANPATGRAYYGGANHASISAQETADALNAMREDYRQALAEGHTPAQAWAQIHSQPALIMGRNASPADPMADGMLVKGESGEQVAVIQRQLSQLGYTGADGRPLQDDKEFGPNTQHAVRAFQRDQGLEDDGRAGPLTLGALAVTVSAQHEAEHQPTLADPGHPDHARFTEAQGQLEVLEQSRRQAGLPALFANEGERDNAAGQLAFESSVAGMQSIDAVLARPDGSGLFAVQGHVGDPGALRIYVDGSQARSQDVESSTRQLDDFKQQHGATAEDTSVKQAGLVR